MRSSQRNLSLIAACALLCLMAAPAHAEKSGAVDRVSIWLGGYQADAEGDLRVSNASGTQSTGDQRILEGTDTIYRARFDFLLFESQGFSVDYYRFDRRDTRGVGGNFTFNGVNYSPTGQLSTRTQIDIGNFSYRWWIGGDQTAFGLGIGATYLKFGVDYSASVSAGALGASIIDRNSKHTWAPLGTLGFRHRLNDQVRVYADVSGARKNGDENAGDLVNAGVGIEYFPWQNLGVGAEYGGSRIRYRYKNDDIKANLKLATTGPSVFLRMRF